MKKIRAVGIKGIGHYVPDRILTNFDLEKMVDTSDEWITLRTGIKERRISANNDATSDVAYKAAVMALEDAGLPAEKVDYIILATASPDMFFPSTACIVQDKLGASHAGAFDLSAGCSGFIYSLVVASQLIATGTYENVLVIGAETLSKFTDWTDRNTCVVFGDGAGAVLLGPVEDGKGLIASAMGSDGSGGEMLKLPAGGSRMPASSDTIKDRLHYIKMDGREVFKNAVRYMSEAVENVLLKCNMTTEDITFLIPHQANLRIIQSLGKRLKLREDQVYVNIEHYGNTSSASIVIALSELIQSKRIKENDVIAMTAFGAGYTWASAVIRW
ncbi:MAG: beta-ketoacyl-ACP synthase III [Candidatus Eremiobacterota bacterium]